MASQPRVFYTESEISTNFGDDYDQPKAEDDSEAVPYRYLSQWYLVNGTQIDSDKRIALPDNCTFRKNQVLCGILQGKTHDVRPIHVQLHVGGGGDDGTNVASTWAVDRSAETRGIWVESKCSSSGAWYWLKEPHETQRRIHLPLRAKFGLLSNIVDLLFSDQRQHNSRHLNMTVKQVYERLSCPSKELVKRHNRGPQQCAIFETPFDYVLLTEQGTNFLRTHLHNLGIANTKFYKSLKKTKATKRWTADDYLESAQLAEERSQQTTWGEALPSARRIRPNWVLDLSDGDAAELDEYKRAKSGGSLPKSGAKKKRATNDNDNQRAKKRAKKHEEEEPAEEEQDESRVKQDLIENENGYSARRMVQALNQIRSFLKPIPVSEEIGSWDDVVQKSFAVRDEKSAKAIVGLMRSLNGSLSGECKLLMITAFLNVCRVDNKSSDEAKSIKKLFVNSTPKPNNAASRGPIGIKIFDQWKQEALDTLTKLEPGMRKKNKWYENSVSYLFLLQYVRFVSMCFVIENAEQLNILKRNHAMDWNQSGFLNDVEHFGRTCQSHDLGRACVRAKRHLDEIMKTPSKCAAKDVSAPPDKSGGKPDSTSEIAPTEISKRSVAAGGNVAQAVTSRQSTDDEDDARKRKFAEKRRMEILRKGNEHPSIYSSLPGQAASAQAPSKPIRLAPVATSLPTTAHTLKPTKLAPPAPVAYNAVRAESNGSLRDPSSKQIEPVFVKGSPLFLLNISKSTAYSKRKAVEMNQSDSRQGAYEEDGQLSSDVRESSFGNSYREGRHSHRDYAHPEGSDRRFSRGDRRSNSNDRRNEGSYYRDSENWHSRGDEQDSGRRYNADRYQDHGRDRRRCDADGEDGRYYDYDRHSGHGREPDRHDSPARGRYSGFERSGRSRGHAEGRTYESRLSGRGSSATQNQRHSIQQEPAQVTSSHHRMGVPESGFSDGRGGGSHMAVPSWRTGGAQPATLSSGNSFSHSKNHIRESMGDLKPPGTRSGVSSFAGTERGCGANEMKAARWTRETESSSQTNQRQYSCARPPRSSNVGEVRGEDPSAARGRGRGAHMTQPAWMTREL